LLRKERSVEVKVEDHGFFAERVFNGYFLFRSCFAPSCVMVNLQGNIRFFIVLC